MGPRILLSGPNASGLETQVLGPHSDETLPQIGRETIQVARPADIQGPFWNQCEFHCRDGFYRYYHLIVEDLKVRRVTVFSAFSIKEQEVLKKTVTRCLGVPKPTLANTPNPLVRLPLTVFCQAPNREQIGVLRFVVDQKNTFMYSYFTSPSLPSLFGFPFRFFHLCLSFASLLFSFENAGLKLNPPLSLPSPPA